MANTFKWHRQRFGTVSIGTSATNVVLAEIDLNGTDLLAGASNDAQYAATIHTLVYGNNSTLYPMIFVHEAAIQKRSSTYTVQAFELINTGSVGSWVVTLNAAIASTSLFRVRASNVDGTLTFLAAVYMDVKMYNP